MTTVRLRSKIQDTTTHPLGEIPDKLLMSMTKEFIHRMSTGQRDISGNDYADIFAVGVEGEHRNSPLGMIDVIKDNCAWSVKTVKTQTPHDTDKIRIISGRNSVNYSLGITDHLADLKETGNAILSIWNARVTETYNLVNDFRVAVLVRNFDKREFLIYEEGITRYIPENYTWTVNASGNLEGRTIKTEKHCFTWQPHGSQFTIIRNIPKHARRFSINQPVYQVPVATMLEAIGYDDDWIDLD